MHRLKHPTQAKRCKKATAMVSIAPQQIPTSSSLISRREHLAIFMDIPDLLFMNKFIGCDFRETRAPALLLCVCVSRQYVYSLPVHAICNASDLTRHLFQPPFPFGHRIRSLSDCHQHHGPFAFSAHCIFHASRVSREHHKNNVINFASAQFHDFQFAQQLNR